MKKQSMPAVLCICLSAILIFTECRFEKPSPEDKQNEIVLNEAGAVISMPFIWEADVSESPGVWVNIVPIFHKNMVIASGSLPNERAMLVALDTASGEEIWRWNDDIAGFGFRNFLCTEQLNRKDNIAIFNESNLFCAVNLDNGTKLWEDRREGLSHSTSIQIVGDHYYFPYTLEKDGILPQMLMRGSIFSSEYESLVEVPIDAIQLFGGAYGALTRPYLYHDNNKLYALLAFSENLDLYKSQSLNSYVFYNISDRVFTHEKVRLPDTVSIGVVHPPVRIGDVFVISSDLFLYGVDKGNAEIIWTRRKFTDRPSRETFIVATYKNRLFAVNGIGPINLVMELDPQTGNTIWIDEDNGGSVRQNLYFLNDVLYFASRGDGRLYAYDINNGKMLWRLQSPDYIGFVEMQVKKSSDDGGEDMLVACSWKNAYRFEPAR